MKLPQYRSHKIVSALQIKSITINQDTLTKERYALITPAEEGYKPFYVSKDWFLRHNPKQDGYYVIYGDLYASYSPQQQFEEGYSLLTERDRK